MSKKELLKTHTSIPHRFIDDFYHILEEGNPNSVFPIPLVRAAKWLKVERESLIKTLTNSYEYNTDYISTTEDVKRHGGHNKKYYMLTVDCFKRLCQRSLSPRGELARTYFIKIDEFLDVHLDDIVKGILNKTNESAHKVRKHEGVGWIYVFRSKHKVFKHGHTKDLEARIRAYNVGRAVGIKILASFKTLNRIKAEDCVKALNQQKRLESRKELYKVDIDILKRTMEFCAALGQQTLQNNESWYAVNEGDYYVFFTKKDLSKPERVTKNKTKNSFEDININRNKVNNPSQSKTSMITNLVSLKHARTMLLSK